MWKGKERSPSLLLWNEYNWCQHDKSIQCIYSGGIPGFHQAKGVGLDKISLRVSNLIFFFLRYCLHGGDGPCDNETYVALFGFVYLEPCNANDA